MRNLIIEKANGLTTEKLYEMAVLLNQENIGIIIIVEDTKKEINKMFGLDIDVEYKSTTDLFEEDAQEQFDNGKDGVDSE